MQNNDKNVNWSLHQIARASDINMRPLTKNSTLRFRQLTQQQWHSRYILFGANVGNIN